MISFQRLLGQEDAFLGLLEASAREGVHAVEALKHTLTHQDAPGSIEQFAKARREDKKITEEISERLITTFVTPMEREDIEALAEVLYKIPKTVEKFAERYLIVHDQVKDVNFLAQVRHAESAIQLVLQMVQALRAGRNLGTIKSLQAQLQTTESEADDLLIELTARFYEPGFPPLKAVILKDLFDLNEKVVDRCRDAGNVISHVLFKNA